MNHSIIAEHEDDSYEIKELITSINDNIKLFHNGVHYIDANNLVPHRGNITISDHLPSCVYYGTCWLIKNNSILQINSGDVYESIDIRLPSMRVHWQCVVTVHNLDLHDVSNFANTDTFNGMDELTSQNSEKSNNFILALINNGFKLYTRRTKK